MDKIVIRGAKVLKEVAKEVPKELFGTPKLKSMLKRMSVSLRTTEHGVAIAANQIGLPYRIFVVRGFIMEGKERSAETDVFPDAAFVNPTIVRMSKKKELMDEACLSVPNWHGTVMRAPKASVRAYDEQGKKIERGGAGLVAQVFQHECDHLEGILYVEKAEEVFQDEDSSKNEEKHKK